MNTATATPITEQADRFRCEAEVPDPPRDAAGRKQYWEDTVAEAVAELRRRLASTRDEKSFQALQMVLDLEKTRLRHKTPVAGTEVSGGRWADGLEPLPVYTESHREFALKKVEAKTEDLTPPTAPATLSVPEVVEDEVVGEVARLSESETPSPTRRVGLRQNDDGVLNTPSPERGGGRGVGSSSPEPPPPHGRYRYVQYPLDAPINTMTDDEYNAYRRWQGFWPGVPPGWPNWPPKSVASVADPDPTGPPAIDWRFAAAI